MADRYVLRVGQPHLSAEAFSAGGTFADATLTYSAGGSGLHPNEPSGMSELMHADGSTANPSGTAFGISGWSNWYYVGSTYDSSRISTVADASNPTGSGSAVRRWWRTTTPSGGTDNGGSATADYTYPGGPFSEVYIALRILHRNANTNHKFYYHILDGEDVGSAQGPWPTMEGGEDVKIQACGVNLFINSHPDIDELDTELLLEWHWKAESSFNAGDGEVYYWINGTLVGSRTSANPCTFSCYTSSPNYKFKGMHFYGQANVVSSDFYEDIRELYISAKN